MTGSTDGSSQRSSQEQRVLAALNVAVEIVRPNYFLGSPSYRPLFLLHVLLLAYVLSSNPLHVRLSGRRMSIIIFSIICIAVFTFITFVALLGLPVFIVFIALANTLIIIVIFSLFLRNEFGDRTWKFFRQNIEFPH